jgi:NAD-dependent dihydropyrimidine dehydrogenase PreA subunit
MPEATVMGAPRALIPWHPTIDSDKCNYCMACDEFCPHRVFERREGERSLVVANPTNCVVFCRVCAKACPVGALAFPGKPETIALIKRIREEAGAQ